MDREKKVYLEDPELTEADRVVLRLYEETAEPVEWDESDDAILAFSRSIQSGEEGGSSGSENGQSRNPTDTGEPAELANEDPSDNVVTFAPRKRTSNGRSFFRSPLAGLSIAASLMVGVIAGQGLSPYVDLGVAPDYQEVLHENQQLTRGLSATRSIRLRTPDLQQPAGSQTTTAQESDLLRIGSVLNDFRCADLSMTLSRTQGIKVSGYVSSADDLERLRSNLSGFEQLGMATQDVQVYGWPVCEALEILATRTVIDADNARAPVVRPFNHGPVYVDGENLVVEARSSGQFEGYLYIDFIQNDGKVLHMLPFEELPQNAVAPGQDLLLGAKDVQYALTAPYGTEMLVIIASPIPLFDAPRAELEPAEGYFKDLILALEGLAGQGYGDQLLSGYSIITTKAK